MLSAECQHKLKKAQKTKDKTMTAHKNIKAIIRTLNDRMRRSLCSLTNEYCLFTPMVAALSDDERFDLMLEVQCFEDFNEDNDPHEEHDFGRIFLKGETYFWKIDYYDNDLKSLSPDASNPNRTKRVLTIMHASEY